MRSQSAVFIDAGSLLAVGGTKVAGTSLRSAFTVDYKKLVQGITILAAEHSGLPLLRVYWYDAAKDALFTEQHKKIGMLPDVKVRLGRLSFGGGQKGVDLKLGLDLVGIARQRAAEVAYLFSGDDDLAEAVEEAQDLGMKVVLIGVEDRNHRVGIASVAEHLALRVDSMITLPNELITECFVKSVATTPRPAPTGVPPVTGSIPLPHPPAKPATRPTPAPPTSSLPAIRPARPDSDLIYSSGGPNQGPQRDGTPFDVASDVGESVAASWYGSTTEHELQELLAERPILPGEIDRVLLQDCAQRIGESRTESQGVRRALREAFWNKLDTLI